MILKEEGKALEVVEIRRCHGCKKELPLTSEYFYKRKSYSRVFYHSCKNCMKEYDKNIRVKHQPKKVEGSKECTFCNKIKDIIQFSASKKIMDGRRNTCKKCQIYYKISYNYLNLDKQLTIKDQVFLARQIIQKYLIIQYNSCDICKIEFEHKNWYVDHCHKNGHMRGLLCNKCNSGLGYIEDTTFIINAKKYLQKDRGNHGSTC